MNNSTTTTNNFTTTTQNQEWMHPFDVNPPIACSFPLNSTTPFYLYIYCSIYFLGCLAVIIAGAYFYIRSLYRKHLKDIESGNISVYELGSIGYGHKPNQQNIIQHA